MSRRPFVTILVVLILTILVWPLKAQEKPFTHDQVSKMVQAGLGDDSGSKLIEQRGIDFAPSQDFIQTLKVAGASEAFLSALRVAKLPQASTAKQPLDELQVILLLAGQVPNHRVTTLVQERGIDFDPTEDSLQEVRLAGGGDELISALKDAKVTKPEHVDPSVQALQEEIRQHVARAAELVRGQRYSDAEIEYREALRLDPQDADLHARLGAAAGGKSDWDVEIAEEREALRLNPNDDFAHSELGNALGQKGNWDGDIAEQHQALRLNSENDLGHYYLGTALGRKGDWDGDVAEERTALHSNPNNETARLALGEALYGKRAVREALDAYQETLRLNWACPEAHFDIGRVLEDEQDFKGAVDEYREAVYFAELDEANAMPNLIACGAGAYYHIQDYAEAYHHRGLVYARLGDFLSADSDLEKAVKLDPSNARMHLDYGQVCEERRNESCDANSALAQYRLARDLDPNNDLAHYYFGKALEFDGKRREAFEEYRTAHELKPENADYRKAYERLLRKEKP